MYERKTCITCGKPPEIIHPAWMVSFLNERIFGDNYRLPIRAAHCEPCGVIWTVDRFTDEELEKLYKDYENEEYNELRIKHEPEYADYLQQMDTPFFHTMKTTLIDLIIKENDQNWENCQTVLDFGGNDGRYIPKIFDNSTKFVYDISGVETVDGVEIWDQKTKSDFTMILHVLEHVSEPKKVLESALKTVNTGGLIYVEVPTVENPPLPNGEFHEHINSFSPSGMTQLFNSVGIDIINEKIVKFVNGENATYVYGILGKVNE